MPQRLVSVGAAQGEHYFLYLIAAKVVADIHDEGLPSAVVLTYIQTLIGAQILDLQRGEQRGNRITQLGVGEQLE